MVNLTRLQRMVRQLRKLPENMGLSEEELTTKAQQLLDAPADTTTTKPAIDSDLAVKFSDRTERRMAQDLLGRYLADYQIESVSERNTLQEIIYLEVLQLRLQEKLNQQYSTETKFLPFDIIGVIHKNSEMISKLKSTLGLNKSKEKVVGYDAFTHMQKRWRKWREENQAGRSLKCPHCQQWILLKMRMEAWESQQHPFFRDNTIYNKVLFANLGKTIEITRDFIAKVLDFSPDYVDWMIAKSKPIPLAPTQNETIETTQIEPVQQVEQPEPGVSS